MLLALSRLVFRFATKMFNPVVDPRNNARSPNPRIAFHYQGLGVLAHRLQPNVQRQQKLGRRKTSGWKHEGRGPALIR
jgi:hypothetical protein